MELYCIEINHVTNAHNTVEVQIEFV